MYLLDNAFLQKLDAERNKTTYAKITLLTWNEDPIEEIQGRITQGTVNVDGSSAVRRTCSLTMILRSDEIDVSNTHWALRNKFKLEVGVENKVDPKYPDICWFKQGVFVFSSLSMSESIQGFTISLQGKDKMTLLNGEMGGLINASTDFGQLQEESVLDNGEIFITLTQIPIITIIKNSVSFFAGISPEKIFINDIDDYGLELLEYTVQDENYPYLYMLREAESGKISNMFINSSGKQFQQVDEDGNNKEDVVSIKDIPKTSFYNQTGKTSNYIYFKEVGGSNSEKYNILRIGYRDVAGYRITDLTYPGELTINIGESLTTLLDKIKNMFSSFEYFFDINGNFVFQRKKTYINNSWSPIIQTNEEEEYVENSAYVSSSIYTFENEKLFTAFNNNPNLLNFKNDYSIWGNRETADGTELPIHLRYAIEAKPTHYLSEREEKDLEGNVIKKKANFISSLLAQKEQNVLMIDGVSNYVVDWREIIYQMAEDYYSLNERDDFKEILKRNNPEVCRNGRTGYENFYTDILGFWRQLYFPYFLYKTEDLVSTSEKRIAARWLYKQYKSTKDLTKAEINMAIENGVENHFWIEYYQKDFYNNGYSKALKETPETLNFYFDFLDINSELGKYAISSIGSRSKTINDNKIKSIYYKETPQVIFVRDKEIPKSAYNTGYTFMTLDHNYDSYFTISSQGKSAWDELQTLLYQYTNLAENITITAVPIYYLEPNNIIEIHNDEINVHGSYVINKLTVPLNYNGSLSISASKIAERIY